MPTITKLPFNVDSISLSVERANKRSRGIHLSSILKHMRMTAGIERKYKTSSPEDQKLIFETGFMWENAVAEYIQSPENRQIELDEFFTKFGLKPQVEYEIDQSHGALVRPGEHCIDGIYCTPDAMNVKLWHLEEWKATAIRSKGFSITERRIEWYWQAAAYLKACGMTRCVFRVWHTGEMPQAVTQWVVEWSTEEIENTWNMILSHYTNHMKEKG